jgi:two-component system, NtrC family, response regulator GlrR
MIVDDDPDILKLLGMCLEAEGCLVREAASAEIALGMLEHLDVVVVDQRMPTMTGTELIAEARSRGHTCRFLVISGKRGARQEASLAGAEGFLAKPIGMRELITEVERLFYRDASLQTDLAPAATNTPTNSAPTKS